MVQLKLFKEVGIANKADLGNWHKQGWPGRHRVLNKAYEDKVGLLITQQAGG